jgi:hypothetical protein
LTELPLTECLTRLEEMAERAAQAQPVKTGQNACHGMTESVKKGRREKFVGSSPNLLSQRPVFRHFGCGLAALGKR